MTAATAVPHRGEVPPEVLRRARSGDHHAFTEVVRHYDHRLRALAFRLLGDRGAMDDALQEAYVKAFRALPGFLLVDAEGLGYDTAATVLGVAPGTIASRLSRARAALRAALDEGEPR